MKTATSTKWVELAGSYKNAMPGTRVGEPRHRAENVEVLVRLRRKNAIRWLNGEMCKRLTYEKYVSRHGAAATDVRQVEKFAKRFGLKVKTISLAQRTMILSGKLADMCKAFCVTLKTHHLPNGAAYRGRDGNIFLPIELKGVITGVFGLDERPVVRSRPRRVKLTHRETSSESFQTVMPKKSFLPNTLANLYNFPPSADGRGQTVGIVEIGGGFRRSDLKRYFKKCRVPGPPRISVATFRGGAANIPAPINRDAPNFEVLTDIEILGAIVPKAKVVMYFGKDGSTKNSLIAMQAAIHDQKSKPDVLSVSWGTKEYEPNGESGQFGNMEQQYQDSMNDLFETARVLGITICVSTGDYASACATATDPSCDGRAHVEFPASSPLVLSVGGTHIINASQKRLKEEVWHPSRNTGTGGGISRYFKRPNYQKRAVKQIALNPRGTVGRGIPDVSANAAGESGYRILIDGRWYDGRGKKHPAIGGTSCATPLWAALIARLNQIMNTRLGFINPLLYELPRNARAFHDITKGNNGDYCAKPGWNPCTGLGTPNGIQLLRALEKHCGVS